MQLGAGAFVKQTVPVRGLKASSFQTASITGSAYYAKPINRCTTPCDSGFSYSRQDTGGRSLLSDQLSGVSLVNHQVIASLESELDILEKLSLHVSYIWVMQWLYPVGERGKPLVIATGPVQPEGGKDAQTFRISPWILASIDYSVIDEIDLSLGYYNYTNQIGPDGKRRNPMWSPDARFFLTVTANLDSIYETATTRSRRARASNKAKAPVISQVRQAKF
jgi:hypothetical protein